jgi:hypothetical protein
MWTLSGTVACVLISFQAFAQMELVVENNEIKKQEAETKELKRQWGVVRQYAVDIATAWQNHTPIPIPPIGSLTKESKYFDQIKDYLTKTEKLVDKIELPRIIIPEPDFDILAKETDSEALRSQLFKYTSGTIEAVEAFRESEQLLANLESFRKSLLALRWVANDVGNLSLEAAAHLPFTEEEILFLGVWEQTQSKMTDPLRRIDDAILQRERELRVNIEFSRLRLTKTLNGISNVLHFVEAPALAECQKYWLHVADTLERYRAKVQLAREEMEDAEKVLKSYQNHVAALQAQLAQLRGALSSTRAQHKVKNDEYINIDGKLLAAVGGRRDYVCNRCPAGLSIEECTAHHDHGGYWESCEEMRWRTKALNDLNAEINKLEGSIQTVTLQIQQWQNLIVTHGKNVRDKTDKFNAMATKFKNGFLALTASVEYTRCQRLNQGNVHDFHRLLLYEINTTP